MRMDYFNNEEARIITLMKEFGLTLAEAKTYLALLKFNNNSASVIAKKAKMNRSQCYITLENLEKKGFVEKLTHRHLSYFQAKDSEEVLKEMKEKQINMLKKLDLLKKTFELFSKQHPSRYHTKISKPYLKFYQGESGLQSLLDDTLTAKTLIRAYVPLSDLENLIPNYFPNYYKRRSEKKINVRAIYPADQKSFLHKLRDHLEYRESRLIPNNLNFQLDLLIYDEKISIISLEEKFGILIKSERLSKTFGEIYDLAWENIKKIDLSICKKFRMEQKKEPSSDGSFGNSEEKTIDP